MVSVSQAYKKKVYRSKQSNFEYFISAGGNYGCYDVLGSYICMTKKASGECSKYLYKHRYCMVTCGTCGKRDHCKNKFGEDYSFHHFSSLFSFCVCLVSLSFLGISHLGMRITQKDNVDFVLLTFDIHCPFIFL